VSFKVSRAYVYTGAVSANLHVGGMYTGAFEAAVVWDDAGVINAVAVTGSGNTAEVAVSTNNVSGNAVVKIYTAGDRSQTPVWSYHIWVTGYNPDDPNAAEHETFTNTYNTNNNGSHFVFMDRNLGATEAGLTAAARGVSYQWGRKDPFPATGPVPMVAADATAGTVAYAIKHPDKFITTQAVPHDWHYAALDNSLWGHNSSKSIYDPCPAGWRVPTNSEMNEVKSPWYGFTDANGTWTSDEGWSWGTNADYPMTGFRSRENGDLYPNNLECWCASPVGDSNRAMRLFSMMIYKTVAVAGSETRAYGFPTRCVRE
jgi:hypothetical protein